MWKFSLTRRNDMEVCVQLTDIYWYIKDGGRDMKPTLVVLAAGMGSRYGGVKQIDGVGPNGECLFEYTAYDAMVNGFKDVVFIIRPDIEADFRARAFDKMARNIDCRYVFQTKESLLTKEQIASSAKRTKPWGTVHALLCAAEAVKGPFAVVNSDDYYGRQGFKTLGTYLGHLTDGSREHAMVGYPLEVTMSVNGSVSRGICEIKSGAVVSITEQHNIFYEGKQIVAQDGDAKIHITGDTWVSMNLFGFGRSAMSQFQAFWDRFIADNAASEKAECLLPSAVNEMISEGNAKLRFFSSSDHWFGMTYSDDRQQVKDEIGALVKSGYYPDRLWAKD